MVKYKTENMEDRGGNGWGPSEIWPWPYLWPSPSHRPAICNNRPANGRRAGPATPKNCHFLKKRAFSGRLWILERVVQHAVPLPMGNSTRRANGDKPFERYMITELW